MKVYESDQPVYFDVDSTLIEYEKGSLYEGFDLREPIAFSCYGHKTMAYEHKAHINFLKTTKQRGRMVIVWSQQGARWAEEVVKKLGLEEYVDICLTKPICYVDDLNATAWMGPPVYFKKGY